MTAPVAIPKRQIKQMLGDCAPGSSLRRNRRGSLEVARYNGKTLYAPRSDKAMDVDYLVKMVSHLEIDQGCARSHFPDVTFG